MATGVQAGAPLPGNPRVSLHGDGEFLARLLNDGSTLMVGGFGEPGTPFFLLDRLARAGRTELTIIKNDANEPGVGVGALLRAGLLRQLIASHIGLNPEMVDALNRGEVDVKFHPQGILAEKVRCGGVGIPAFLSDIGVGVLDDEEIDWNGDRYVVEPALRADVALIHAHRADPYGNLTYRKSARNFNPLMALAARIVVVEAEELVDHPLDPECVHTPGSFVDHLVVVPANFEPDTKAAAIRKERAGGR